MYHVLTIEWEAKNLFTGRMAAHRVSYRLTWEGGQGPPLRALLQGSRSAVCASPLYGAGGG